MEQINIVFRALAASQEILFLVLLALSNNPLRVRVIGAALLLGILSYLLTPIFYAELSPTAILPLFFMAKIIPAILLLFTWVVFEESAPIPIWIWFLIFVDVFISAAMPSGLLTFSEHVPVALVRYILSIVFVCLAIYVVWRGRDNDLVERRQTLRLWFIGCTVFLVLCILAVELLFDLQVPKQIEHLGMGFIFVFSLLVMLAFVKFNPQLQLVGIPIPIRTRSEDPFLQRLLKQMTDERLYADHQLRVGSLAEYLGMPEHQLRKKINQGLGYRNFNQFVNRYRIEEASSRLLSEPGTPILSIALDVGFSSISSFNTAFRAQFGVAPSDYRSE